MLRHAVLVTAGAFALAAPVAASAAPASLPPVERALSAAAGSCDTAAYQAPKAGFLNVRLAGRSGDWDLALRDAATDRPLRTSRSFGSDELIQGFVTSGQKLIAQACRRAGASPEATASFELVDVAPPAEKTASLVRVPANQGLLERLQALGLDVTEHVRNGQADVVVAGAKQLGLLRGLGLTPRTRIADLGAFYAQSRRADAAYAARVDGRSSLPSGRTGYRDLDDIQAELKQLVADHPDTVRPVTIGTSFQGRSIDGVEIADDVNGADGRPVFFLMGVHHAREWPAAEAVMEFAHLLASDEGARVRDILRGERVVLVPVVNVDGYVASRSAAAIDPADAIRDANGGEELDPLGTGLPLSTVESIVPPGGILTYRRKNCDGAIPDPNVPCELQWGVDNNRNYGNLWGGPGASPDPTSQSFHGAGPRSEPETQAVWNYARTHQVTMLISMHNVAALVLRPPGLAQLGLAPDEQRMKEIGDAMAADTGYTSQYSWQLYDTAGTTEDDTYAATGGYGYTIEMGPVDGAFHMPYEAGVVAQWDGTAAGNGKGLRDALLLAAEAAKNPSDHAVVSGSAPAGSVLRLHKDFVRMTSEFCPIGIDPVVSITGPLCPGGTQPAQALDDTLDATTTVPASGQFTWHVNPSTRPFVGGGQVVEELEDEPYDSQESGATSDGRVPFTVRAQDAEGAVTVTLTPTVRVEDYDLEVYRVQGGRETLVGTSGNPPGAADEQVVLSKPVAGDYVAKVVNFTALTNQWSLAVDHFSTTRTTVEGRTEAYTLTCETPAGAVLGSTSLVIARGEARAITPPCGQTPPASAAASKSTVTASPKKPRTASKQRAAARKRAVAKCRAKAKRVKAPVKRRAAVKRCGKLA